MVVLGSEMKGFCGSVCGSDEGFVPPGCSGFCGLVAGAVPWSSFSAPNVPPVSGAVHVAGVEQ